MKMTNEIKNRLTENGWQILQTEPLKITILCDGIAVAGHLHQQNVEVEFADPDHLVCMVSTQTSREDLERLVDALGKNKQSKKAVVDMQVVQPKQMMSVRQAVYAPQEVISVEDALGRICAVPTVSCPPAIPIAVSGERIDQNVISALQHHGIEKVAVTKK